MTLFKRLKFGLFISVFPIFGISIMDNSGLTTLSSTDPTFLLRGFYLLISLFSIISINKYLPKITSLNNPFKTFYLFYIGGMILSILINEPTSIKSWLRLIEIFIISYLGIISIYNLIRLKGIDQTIDLFFKIIVSQFIFVIYLIIFFFIVKKDLVYVITESRGARLGASFIQPNTLALGCVCFFISLNYIIQKNKIIIKYVWLMILSITLLLLTGSSSGVLVFILALFFIIYNRITPLKKIFVRSFVLIFVVLGIFILDFSYFNNYISSHGTWETRLIIYRYAIIGVIDNSLTGVGPFLGIKEYLELHVSNEFSYFTAKHTHNLFLDLFLTQGILIGFPMFIILIKILFKSLLFQFSKMKSKSFVSLHLIIIVVIIHGLIESSFFGVFKPFCHNYIILSILLISFNYKRQKNQQ